MNIEALLLPDYVYQILLFIIAIVGIPWIILRRKFLLELQRNAPETWKLLGSPTGFLLFSPLKSSKVESFISRKRWESLSTKSQLKMAKKLYIIQRVLLITAIVFVLFLFGPLLINELNKAGIM